jgi:leader peptidase (prepilin peptidase)/N-methyltransferase
MTSSYLVLLTAGCTAAAAFTLTPWGRVLGAAEPGGSESRWLRRGNPALLATVGGVGAALLANDPAELVAFSTLAVACALLVLIDLAVLRVPNVIVGPMYVILFAALAAAAALSGDWWRFGRAAAVAGLLVAGYFVLAFFRPADLGLGDVKLSGLLGAFLGWLGWSEAILGTLAAFAMGGGVALILVLTVRATRRSDFAFGPCMILGAAVGAAWGSAAFSLG